MTSLPLIGDGSAKHTVLIEYRPWPGDPWLIGYADVSFDGIIVQRIPVYRRKDGSLNVGQPDTVREDGGHATLITFADKAAKQRWRDAVLAALAQGGITDKPLLPFGEVSS
jgi:hypothetical protein